MERPAMNLEILFLLIFVFVVGWFLATMIEALWLSACAMDEWDDLL